MNLIKQLYKGESLSFSLVFPNDYDMDRIESHSIWIGEQKFVGVPNGQAVELFLKSSETKNIAGVQKLFLWLDDSTFGVKKYDLGSLDFIQTKATDSNDSINLGFDVLVTLSITETAITIDNVLYNYFKGTDANVTPDLIGELIETTELITVTDNTKIAVSDSAFLKYVKGLSIYTYIKSKLDLIYQPLKSVLELYVSQVEKDTWNGKQSAIGFTPENVANKQNSLAVDGTGTKYPTVDAVNGYILPITTYTFNSNKEVIVSSVDVATNTFTSNNHGLANGNSVSAMLNLTAGAVKIATVVVGGMTNVRYYIINATTDTFQISTSSGGSTITLSTLGTTDLTKWHFERYDAGGSITISSLPAKKRYLVRLFAVFIHPTAGINISPNLTTWGTSIWGASSGGNFTSAQIGGSINRIGVYDIEFCSYPRAIVKINGSTYTETLSQTNDIRSLFSLSSLVINSDITKIDLSTGAYLGNGTTVEIYNL